MALKTSQPIKLLGLTCSPRHCGSQALFASLSSAMLQGVLEKAAEHAHTQTETINLAVLNLKPCSGCFSDVETRCHFLCDCHEDDFQQVARKLMAADGVLFATPTYMFGMSSTLQRFFERWISFKAPPIDPGRANKTLNECFALSEALADGSLNTHNPLQGKVAGIVVAGSELGQDKVVRDMMLILNLYGFILPPQCFIYHTGHSMQSLEEVREGFCNNQWLLAATDHLARCMVQTIQATCDRRWPQMPAVLRKT